jgi:regulator of replication initiation timing
MSDNIDDIKQAAAKVERDIAELRAALIAAIEYITKLEHENAKLRRYREGL